MIGVVTALHQESRALRRCCYTRRAKKERGLFLWEQGEELVVIESGMGIDAAVEGAALLAHRYPLHSLYSLGFAGGVAAGLQTGDVVIGKQIYCVSTTKGRPKPRVFSTDCSLEKRVQEASQQAGLRSHIGSLLTIDRVVGSREEKRQLQAEYPVLALDMESGGVAAVAQRYDLPFLAIRIIFDDMGEDFPLSLLQLSDKQGQVKLGPVVQYLVTHSAALPTLLRTARRWYKAQQALHSFCHSWLEREIRR